MLQLSSTSRAILFWSVCIPIRVQLTTLARTRNPKLLRLFAAALGARWLSGGEVGNEGAFGGPAFWADERVLHGALWAAYALNLPNSEEAWKFLAFDTLFGAVNWIKG